MDQLETKMEEKKIKKIAAVVVSKSGNKSIKVAIDYKVKHPKYGKYMKRRRTLSIHDELNQANVGDVVEVCECRPVSRTKSWRLVSVSQKFAE